jgi:hypothetical protein
LAPKVDQDPKFQMPDTLWFVPPPRRPRGDPEATPGLGAAAAAVQRLRGTLKGARAAALAVQAR